MRRCFVISPIGEEGSATREHSDDVFDFIIKPAMETAGYQVHRGDHLAKPGKITDQIFNAILEDDICLAVLNEANPNVFYELAVAQSAGRPIIILMHKGSAMPFDVKDLRAVPYDLKPRPLRDHVYVDQILNFVKEIENSDFKVEVPFGKDLSPLGATDKSLQVFQYSYDFGGSRAWIDAFRNARENFDISGIALQAWTKYPDFRDMFLKRANEGCKIRILTMHPDNGSLSYITKVDVKEYLDTVRAEIRSAEANFADLAQQHEGIEYRQLKDACPHQQLLISEDQLIVIPYLSARSTTESPLLSGNSASPLYQQFRDEFEHMWRLSAPGGKAAGGLRAVD